MQQGFRHSSSKEETPSLLGKNIMKKVKKYIRNPYIFKANKWLKGVSYMQKNMVLFTIL